MQAQREAVRGDAAPGSGFVVGAPRETKFRKGFKLLAV